MQEQPRMGQNFGPGNVPPSPEAMEKQMIADKYNIIGAGLDKLRKNSDGVWMYGNQIIEDWYAETQELYGSNDNSEMYKNH